jgi:DNA-binding beta-propeller fold protein YncE
VILAAGVAVLWALHLPPKPAAAQTDPLPPEAIFCGVPLARHLPSDAAASFDTSLLPGTIVSADVIPAVGLLQMQAVNFATDQQTCMVDLVLAVPQSPLGMTAEPSTIKVSHCLDNLEHDYTVTLSVVSAGPDNCAIPLPCGTAVKGGYPVANQVSSYSFPGVDGDTVNLTVATSAVPDRLQVRIRLFDPSGAKIADDAASCSGQLSKQLTVSGNYTVLISPCSAGKNLPYTITLQPPSCTPQRPAGQFAYVTNADSGTMSVVDLSTNTTKLVTPITPVGRESVGALTAVAITPNGAFAWANYATASSTSVVNTSTNLLMASVPTGLDANGVAFTADSATAYVVANALGGIAVVDTAKDQVTQVVARDIGFSQGIASLTTSTGTFLYVISEDVGDAGGLVRINTRDYTSVVSNLDLGFYDAFAITPDGSQVYAGTIDGIMVIDAATMKMLASIPSTPEPFGIAFTADGRFAYATSPDNGVVTVIDTRDPPRVVSSISNVGGTPAGIAISPTSGIGYVTDATAGPTDPGLFVFDTRTNQVIASTSVLGAGPTGIALTTAPTGLCVGDAEGQSVVTVNELVESVNEALNGCPGQFPAPPAPH